MIRDTLAVDVKTWGLSPNSHTSIRTSRNQWPLSQVLRNGVTGMWEFGHFGEEENVSPNSFVINALAFNRGL